MSSVKRLPFSSTLVLLCCLVIVACGDSSVPHSIIGGGAVGEAPAGVRPSITSLSNRPDLISGNDALVGIELPVEFAAKDLSVQLNGSDVSNAFAAAFSGMRVGLLTGLEVGANTITARVGDGPSSSLVVVNHPSGGPVFAGPQSAFWTCQQGALDVQCNQAPVYRWFYRSTDPSKPTLQPYDPAAPASDVAMTTTDRGVTIPFIVREETGYVDRDQYKIAVVYQPDKPWSAAAPQPQFNQKVLVTHGYGCGAAYGAGAAPDVITYQPVNLQNSTNGLLPYTPNEAVPDTGRYALGAGFAVMSTAMDNASHHCNVVSQAESLMMTKERLIEQYGLLRYTIGAGCSGGSLAQQWIANAYPGIYQGVVLGCSFPDAWSTATQVLDYHLMGIYFGTSTTGADGMAAMPWTPTQVAAVEGSVSPVNAVTSNDIYNSIIPTRVCPGTAAATVYSPITNPNGPRCSIADLGINVFGPRPPLAWTTVERGIGRGFANVAVDNVGVQYGLNVLQQGLITPDMFLDLNAKIGGVDVDANPTTNRNLGNATALANAYKSGMINTASNYDQTAIIDCRGPDPAAAHDAYRAFAIRNRLDQMHGSHANQLIWEGPYPLGADTACAQDAFLAIDRWLAVVEKDTRSVPLGAKIAEGKPDDLGDVCYDGSGVKLSDGLCPDAVVSVYETPRIIAGDSITTLASKCQLKPLDRSDNYGPLGLSDAQWQQLVSIFPDGVCDFSKPPVGFQKTQPWLRYQQTDRDVIYGGVAMPPVPLGSGLGWASPAFARGWPESR